MTQQLRIERPQVVYLMTTRTRNSELWFVNNSALHGRIAGLLAKLQARFNAKLYGFVIQGNHYHLLASFPWCKKPKKKRADFMRDFNSGIQKILKYTTDYYPGGTLCERRFADQVVPLNGDIEDRVFYCALQAVHAGLCPRMSDYPGYNSFSDAAAGIIRKFQVVDWTEYHNKLRWDPEARVQDFTTTYTLKYERIPGYESLSRKDYQRLMLEKLEERRQGILEKRKAEGKLGFPSLESIRSVKPGTRPKTTKKSTRYSFRPLILTACKETKKAYLEFYFAVKEAYAEASEKYRNGDRSVVFPPGTFLPACCYSTA